jgi:phage terminase large subunit-like protein
MALRLDQIDPAIYDFACPDWEARLREGRSLVPELPLDQAESKRAIALFNKLRLPDVAGRPAMQEAAGDWFRDIVGAVFGSVDDEGTRHVREVFGLVPKKNSKTTGGAGIMLTALIMNTDPRQEFLLVGPTQEIADLAFTQAAGMIEADKAENGGEDYLNRRFDVKDHLKTIVDLTNGSTLKIKTFDMRVMTGAKPKGVLIDELHVMSSLSYAARVIGQIRGGLMQKADGFLIIITTQSDEPPAGVFKAELQLARGIRDGRIRGEGASMLPILYEFPEAMQIDPEKPWSDPQHWHMVTPNLGLSISIDRMRADFAQAREKGEEEIRRWASQHLNVQIGLALHSDRWAGADFWQGAAFPPIADLDAMLARSEVAVVGIDGGGLDDLTGVCVAGRDRKTKVWLYWFHAFAHRKVLELRKEIAPRLLDFSASGDLTLWGDPNQPASVTKRLLEDGAEVEELSRTSRDTVDEDVAGIVAICQKVRSSGLLPPRHGIGVDPAAIGALIDALEEAEFTAGDAESDVLGIGQGAANMYSAINTLQRKLQAGTAAHGGAPLMDWCVGNAKAEQRGNAVMITKQSAGKAKIDPLIAGFNATKLLERNPEAGPNISDFISAAAMFA